MKEADYKKIIEGYNNKTIDPKKWQLIMDNDGGYWSYIGPEIDEIKEEELISKMDEVYGIPDGYRDVVSILVGAGVNADWC